MSLLNKEIDTSEPALQFWERQTHALLVCLVQRRCMTTDELRRHIEGLHPLHYENWLYYDKWAAAIALTLLDRGIITQAELDSALGEFVGVATSSTPAFRPGDSVRVKEEALLSRWRKPHLRTPGYIFGARGTVTDGHR